MLPSNAALTRESSIAPELTAQARDSEVRLYDELRDGTDWLLLFPSEQTEVHRVDLYPSNAVTCGAGVRTSELATKPSGLEAPATTEAIRELEERLRDLKALQDLCGRLDQRLLRAAEILQHTATAVADTTLQEQCVSIAKRVDRADEILRRIERALEARSGAQTDASTGQSAPKVGAVGRSAYAWIAAMKCIVAHRTAMWSVPISVLLSVVVIVSAGLNDPRMRSEEAFITSSELPFPVLVAPTIPPIESRSAAVAVASPHRQAAIPKVPKEPLADRTAATQSPAPTQYVGVLKIESEPAGASVFINGRAVGVTPLTLPEQRAGSLALQITMQGFPRWSRAVQVTAGRLTHVTATLRTGSP